MLVTCEKCKSKFNLDKSLVKETGSKVRCSQCRHVFTVFPQASDQAGEADPVIEEQPAAVSSEGVEEPLDFDLFGSEDEQEDEDLSLEDFGLMDDDASGSNQAASEQSIPEDEITPEDLGFGEGTGSEEMVLEGREQPDQAVVEDAPSEEEGDHAAQQEGTEDEISLEGLTLEEEPAATESGEEVKAEGSKDTGEEDLSLEGLSLQEEPVVEEALDAEQPAQEQQDDDGLDFDDLGLEADLSEEQEDATPPADEPAAQADEEPQLSMPDGVPVASVEDTDEPPSHEDGMEDMPAPEVVEQAGAKRGISMPLLISLVVVLLGGGAYAAFTYLNGGVKLPFLESLAGPGKTEALDPGNLHITLLEDGITGGFVDNKAAGRLFVIKGELKNTYAEPRNFIRMKGVLYFKDGKVAKDQIVYCGNVLSDGELQSLGKEAIRKKLNNRFGNNKSNFRVPTGKSVPFMVVFSDLPEDLGEFSVEVVDSMPG
ncbi:MAG: zinc-ribbon domain-containing protein [Deltaproteobacteria bacterium]|nr:zinc-ribbon domain-containing protein [Deltaproteobacteria bacterium]